MKRHSIKVKRHSIKFFRSLSTLFVFRSLKFVFILLLFIVPFTACPVEPLDTWLGTYVFGENGPEDSLIVLEYRIDIYKENDGYFAKIEIDGYQTMTRIKARVKGDQNTLDLIFEEYLPDNMFEPYERGDTLLSFERKDSVLITHWGKMMPGLTEDTSPGEHFKQVSR